MKKSNSNNNINHNNVFKSNSANNENNIDHLNKINSANTNNNRFINISHLQMFDNHNQQLNYQNSIDLSQEQIALSPLINQTYATNSRLVGQNSFVKYADLTSAQQQPLPPMMPPPSMIHSTTQATTAFLVQTSNGSALLIPPQNTLKLQHEQTLNTFSLTRNPYGLTTIPIQNMLLDCNNTKDTINNNIRPESNASTNVYQTIDIEK